MPSATTAGGNEAGFYRLEIRSGLYAGVTQDVGEGRLVLGSGPDADILLMEPDFAPMHAAFVLQDRTIRVEGLAEDVTVAGVGPVPAGAARTLRLPTVVEIAGVALAWDVAPGAALETVPAVASLGLVRRLLARPAVPGLAAAGLLAATVFFTLADPISGAALVAGAGKDGAGKGGRAPTTATSQPAPAAPDPAAPAAAAQASTLRPAPASGPALPPQKPGAVETAAKALREDTAQAGLLNVHVKASGGAVAASGTIEPALAGRWETLQRAFDERFAGDVTLVNSVAVKAEKLPASLGIEGVWRGPQPYIVVRGQRYLAGAVVDGGWTLREIEHDRVMLERDGRLVAMRF